MKASKNGRSHNTSQGDRNSHGPAFSADAYEGVKRALITEKGQTSGRT